MVGFIFGGNTGITYADLQDKRARADLLAAQIMGRQPKTVAEGIGSVLGGIGVGISRYQANKGMREGREGASSLFDKIMGSMTGQSSTGGGSGGNLPMPGAAAEMAATSPADVSQNGSTFSPFMDTVKAGGLTNPFGLSAVAATGRAESGWSPDNAARTWSDPSESGQAGTSGGVMSWRADRLRNLRNYAASKGEQGNGSPQTQAEFFMREDPQLVAKLNAAKSTEEAQQLMNNAWQFAGYNRPGGEAGRRQSYASGYLSQFQGGQGGGTQVASLDPSAGMSGAAAIERQAPGSGYVDPMVSAPNAQPMEQMQAPIPQARPEQPFDVSRFGPEQPQKGGRLPMPAAAPPQQGAGELPPLPASNVAAPPPVASVPQQMAPAPQQVAPPPQQMMQPPQMPQIQPYQIDQRTLQFLASPFADEGQKAAVRSAVEQQQEQHNQRQQQAIWQYRQDYERYQKQSSPEYQLGLDKTRLEVDALRNPREKPTADRQNYEYYRNFEIQSGRTPLGPLEWEQAQRKAGASSTNVTVGEGDKFYEKLDQKNAETFAALSDAGMSARGKIGQINRLEGLFANVPQGIEGGLKKIAGDWGIPIGEGVSDIQAASALLEKMVPEQRAPGSGPMSDADIKMFRASLPRIINQPGGNQLIFQTMRGIAEYEIQMGEIADRVANRERKENGEIYTAADGRRDIQKLKNPLENYKIPDGPTPNEGWNELSPGVKIRRLGD